MRPIAFGCASVVASQVAPGRLSLALAIADRPLALASSSSVASSLDLATVAAAETSAGIDKPWRVLACPVGAGQLALDAIVTASDGGTAASIDNARGALG